MKSRVLLRCSRTCLLSCLVLAACEQVLGLDELEYNQRTGGDGGATTDAPEADAGNDAARVDATDITDAEAATDAACDVALSDEFDDPCTLSNWKHGHVEYGLPVDYDSLTISQSQLQLRPKGETRWNAGTGVFLHKQVTGNFVISAYVSAHSYAGGDAPPTGSWQGAGLAVRSTTSTRDDQSFVLFTMGIREGQETGSYAAVADHWNGLSGYLSIISQHDEPAIAARLVLCRLGDTLWLYRTWANDTKWWNLADTQLSAERGWSDTVELGMAAYAFPKQPDLEAAFDYVRIEAGPSVNALSCSRHLPSVQETPP